MKTNTLDFDAQALREKILDLAMRGKLVPQDPNDEPASVLLEKIKAEKEQLIKIKKIKKSKPLPEITDDEKPFEIPDSWEWVRLGEIGNYIQRGRSPKYDKENFIHPIISQKCIQWDEISLQDAKYITQDFFEKLEGYRFVRKGDILWNSTGTGTVGRVNIVREKFPNVPVDSHVTLVRTNNNVNSQFIYYYLYSPIIQSNLNDYLTGTTKQKELGLNSILKVVLPIPPLSEQSRIAAKIAQLFALLRKVEYSIQQYANLKDLLKSKLLDLAMRGKLVDQDPNDEPANVLLDKIKAEKDQLVKEKKIKSLPEITDDEKPFDIPDSWEWVRLGDVLDVRDGTHDTPKYVSEGVPLITAKNLRNGEIDFSNIKYISENDAIKINERSQVSEGDVLFAMIGTIGNPVLVRTRNNFSIKNVALLKQIAFLNMNFVCQYILGSTKLLMKNASGGNQKFISLKKINKLPFPLPPLSEQSRIVSKLEQLFTLIG